VFPKFFYPEPSTDGINCGMPILGITFGFWIFGTIAGIATHILTAKNLIHTRKI
jgi:hypothetical protein